MLAVMSQPMSTLLERTPPDGYVNHIVYTGLCFSPAEMKRL